MGTFYLMKNHNDFVENKLLLGPSEQESCFNVCFRLFGIPSIYRHLSFQQKEILKVHSVSKETQLFLMDFSWGPGSGSCDPGSWEICILKWGFWQVVTLSIVEMMYNPRFTGIHSSPKERQLLKCCVSFEKECILGYPCED